VSGTMVKIEDSHELQNLLDDYSPDRPHLSVYELDEGIFADEPELNEWRKRGTIVTRDQAVALGWQRPVRQP
jgi:hypothetical protein